jgi:hypothetical protein
MISRDQAIRESRKALSQLQIIILELERAIDEAGFFANEQTIAAAETQIDTLERIYDEIGPRLILQMQDRPNEWPTKFEALKRLLRNATEASEYIANELSVNLTIGNAIKFVLTSTAEDLKEAGTEAVKKAIPLGLIAGAVFALYLIKK